MSAETLRDLPTNVLRQEWFNRLLSFERIIDVSRTRLGEISCAFWVPMQTPDIIPTFVKITALASLLESSTNLSQTTNLLDSFIVEINCGTDFPAAVFPEIQSYCGKFRYPECLLPEKSDKAEPAFSIAMRVREAIEIFEQKLNTADAPDAMTGSTALSDVLLSIKNPEGFNQKAKKGETKQASEDPSAGNYQIIAAILKKSTEDYCRPE